MTSSGLLFEAIVGTALVLFSNILLRLLSFTIMDKIKQKSKERCVLRISCSKDIESVVCNMISRYTDKHHLDLVSMDKDEVTKDELKLVINIITSRPNEVDALVKNLSAEAGVLSLSWKHNKFYKTDNEDGSVEE